MAAGERKAAPGLWRDAGLNGAEAPSIEPERQLLQGPALGRRVGEKAANWLPQCRHDVM